MNFHLNDFFCEPNAGWFHFNGGEKSCMYLGSSQDHLKKLLGWAKEKLLPKKLYNKQNKLRKNVVFLFVFQWRMIRTFALWTWRMRMSGLLFCFLGFFFFCQLFVLIILIFLKFYFIISYYFFDAWQLLLFHIIHHICSIIKYPCFQIDDQLLWNRI